MSNNRNLKALAATVALPLLFVGGVSPDAPGALTLVQDARAVVGAPLTPVSAAGVARRTTRRVAVAETSATQQQQAATAQQQAATAQQQAATAQQQAAAAQPQAAARPPGAPAAGAVVSALPAGCQPVTQNGVEYQNCGGVYYRAAFQGNNLVYVVQ